MSSNEIAYCSRRTCSTTVSGEKYVLWVWFLIVLLIKYFFNNLSAYNYNIIL